MQPAPLVFVGVDVAKATLSSFVHDSKARRDFSNEPAAIQAWLDQLPANALIAVESTGRYHQLLVTLAVASGRQAFVLNARDVFFYARALGQRGKTDRTDAQVIARYLAEHHAELRPWTAPSETQSGLQALLRCRSGVATKKSSLRQILKGVDDLRPDAAELEDAIDALLERIDAKIARLIEADAALQEHVEQLRTIPGVGALGAAMLASLFSRVPFANADAVVAFSGLDPRPNDSGARTGRRRISKRGSPVLRRQLYLCAFSAGRTRQLRDLYTSIKAKGFKPTQALIILARKLLRVAWAIWNSHQSFNPGLLGQQGACAQT